MRRSSLTRRPARPGWRLSIAAALYGLVGLAPHVARGDAVGYQLNHYEPVPAGDPFLVVESPGATSVFAGGLSFDYAYHLLVADPAAAPISHATSGHLDLAGTLFERVGLSLSVPVVIDQAGTTFAGVGPTGTTAGDPRLGVRARLYGRRDELSLSAAAYVWIPIGVEDHLTGDAGARGLGRLTLGGVARDRVRWAINGSVLARRTAVLSATTAPTGNTVGSELQFGAAAGVLALDHRLSIGPEALVSIALAELPTSQDIATLEVFGSARYKIDDRFGLGLGVGTAIAGSGSPDARVLLSLTYAPSRAHDEPSSSFERVIVLPDEDGHVGAVEVNDGTHKELLDHAYASTELRKDGKIRPVQSSAAKVEQDTTASVVRALPPPDRDGDGFVDAEDGCPDRAGLASLDPIRRGCPAATEKVVVLPDEDGHVGGVEIDDGHGVTVLDQPYASAEVDAGGTAHAVTSPSPRAVATVTMAIAQTLPVADDDDDTILDRDDACPARPGVRSSDPIRNGCPDAAERIIVFPDPDGHVGGVEIDDGHGKTIVDQPYASAEIGRDGVAHAVAPSSPRAVDHAIAAIALTLPPADADGDGTRDEVDACPEIVGSASVDPLRAGCPVANEKVVVLPDADGHVGAIEIDDGQHVVLLDAAYATAEVANGQVRAVPAIGASLTARALATILRALPAPDRDDDGIADGDDACPTRPGPASSDATQQGCPRRAEQVVVLPDENGTVGAVEVDDGTTKIVLDKAYASAEIGVDGQGRAVPTDAAAVSAGYGAAMAARPAGARIILYFTARSEPARDLTGPIDNLVAEVKAKTTYMIDVIGHTDQTGSEAANVKIGRERAQLIADRLIAAGVPADHIKVSSMGSREPAVKRASRTVVELRNRRVEIWMR